VALVLLVLLEAEAVDSRTAAVALLLVAEREVLPPPFVLCFLSLSFSPLSSFSLVFFPPVFLSFGSPFFFSPVSLFWFFRSPPLSSVFSFSSPPSVLFLSLSFSFRSWGSIYRAQGVALYMLSWGAAGWSAIGRDCQGSAPPPRFSGRCAVGGRPLCPVGGLQAREWPAKIQKKKSFPFSFFPAACSGGKKKDEQCRSKRHRSALFFFFECMKR